MVVTPLTRILVFTLLYSGANASEETLIEVKDPQGAKAVYFQGEPASDGKVVLDANNGFFDKGSFRALGKREVGNAEEKKLISAHFDSLQSLKSPTKGAVRWYIWAEKSGEVAATVVFGNVLKNGEKWRLRCGEQSVVLESASGEATTRVDISLKAGLQILELRNLEAGGSEAGPIKSITLSGGAASTAKLLRARWRPAAVHARYSSKSCPRTKMWVFETRNDLPTTNYSPITTSFGYFGASFDQQQRAEGGINFSMWAASSHTEEVPELSKMPHLIATGNPHAEFSGFGHEGSGVKIRNWEPFSHHPKSVIQALRVETDQGMDTFYGYIYDEPSLRWKLYASAMRPQKLKKKNDGETWLRVGSFCEVPGPPQVQRTGDQRRQVARRGWFMGEGEKWHAVDTIHLGSKGEISSKAVGVSEDGWLTMATGGVAMAKPTPTAARENSMELPEYLTPEKAGQLFQLPVKFGADRVRNVSTNSAEVVYDIESLGSNAQAILYYGPVDCLSFVERKLHGTEKKGVSRLFLSSDRTWQEMLPSQAATAGENAFLLKDLKPQAKYFYRLFIQHDEGKSWAYRSGQFTTK